jgi:hypothetical protein
MSGVCASLLRHMIIDSVIIIRLGDDCEIERRGDGKGHKICYPQSMI